VRDKVVVLCIAAALTAAVSRGAPPNIILISIDTLRADHLGAYGYPGRTSPFIDSLAAKGLVFDHATVSMPSTTPSHASMMTGLYPAKHGSTTLLAPMSPNVDTLAAALSRKGYHTAAAVGIHLLGRPFHFDHGFADFSAPSAGSRKAATVNADLFADIDRYAARSPRPPLFLWAHYFDCHAPYGWWKANTAAEVPPIEGPREDLIRRYDESIRHVDDAVRQLLERLEARGLLKNAVICITADHGEQIGERGYAAGHVDIYGETVRVPLIFAGGGVPRERSVARAANLDIAPTLARLAGASLRGTVDGKNLLSERALLSRLARTFVPDDVSKDERELLVAGNPSYARSLELIRGRYWYIRNFDSLYRNVFVSDGAAGGTREIKPIRNANDVATFVIPATSYVPYLANLTWTPPAGCEAELVTRLQAGVTYFTLPKQQRRATTMRFPAARLDVVTIDVKPSKCAGAMSYAITRLESPADAARIAGTPRQSTADVFLQTPRKASMSDELYDVVADPGMTRNLIAAPALQGVRGDMERRLRRLYTSVVGNPLAARQREMPLRREDIEKLRSLGYLF
jgi:arylsulfatase A-like enzyme